MFKINEVPVTIERYPDGTPRLNLETDKEETILEWLYERDEEMILFLITKHLRERLFVKKLTLYMPYIPHARMDRVKEKDEVFTLKYFCEFINALEFDQVIVRDAHSNVSLALLNRVSLEPVDAVIKALTDRLLDSGRDILFYPDEGSCKRYSAMFSFPYAYGVKKRDWKTGKIEGVLVQGKIPEKSFHALIIDDISSFGGTFLHSARKLKELGADKIYLYISHCENSILKGELINSGLIEKIYTTRSIYTGQHPLIECVDRLS